ncbi:MAG: Membrane protein insertase YidC [Candidatus Ordinivivax streblomastigis]|uniref:Membrane protein insertase YidC n=1 Tax=Candidatus Ordinivivax streblomastigis TaxID=2540710 RepID=A0A5M8P0P1_9BACT|nr:MAG: Membrane protein insertase YidC [Candidatus Ordinivivax streblomastigis]
MDKNTLIGFVLIFLVIIGFSYFNQPSKEQIAARQRYNDSIAIVQRAQADAAVKVLEVEQQAQSAVIALPDSVRQAEMLDKYGSFGVSSEGTEEVVTLENDLMEIRLTTKGGYICSARLKNYTDYEAQPLYLFNNDESNFEMTFITANNRVLTTKDFYFEVIPASEQSVTLRLNAGENKSLDLVYTLHSDDYMVDFSVVSNNLQTELSPAMRTLDIQWMQKLRQQEKGRKYEERYARLTYKYLSDEVEELRESKDDIQNIPNKLKWIGYKDQFFSSVLIAGDNFESAKLDSKYLTDSPYMKIYNTSTSVPYRIENTEPVKLNFYFGPNDYALLKNYDKTKFIGQNLELEKLVPLGWSLFRAVNKYIIIPIFDWLTDWNIGLGLAIFLLTLIIKTALFPLTYKSFMSSAKMRVLKPQVEAISAKYPGQDNALARQQKTMELYKQVGVSPMAGCVPMLLQMPFLLALFMFFPSAIELRHQSFLWADDLSTFDSIIHWNTYIPLVSKYLGNHISLFCLLMSVVTIVNTKFTMDQQNTGQQQMPGMKVMMYIMPVMMFFFLNSYPAGLNYYYLISTLITVLQTYAFRFFIDEKTLLVKLEANKSKAKPAKKKSGFMARLEEAQRQQQALLRERQKQQQKRK